MTTIKTLMGYTFEDSMRILAEPLPPECYTSVPGGAKLTDIDPVARDVVLNNLFGPCGLGWYYDYDTVTIENTKQGSYDAKCATVSRLGLVVLWEIDGDLMDGRPIYSAGSSTNKEPGYAAKGAVTSAISGAANKLGWQQLVYQGIVTHLNAEAVYAKYGPHPFEEQIRHAMLEIKQFDVGVELTEFDKELTNGTDLIIATAFTDLGRKSSAAAKFLFGGPPTTEAQGQMLLFYADALIDAKKGDKDAKETAERCKSYLEFCMEQHVMPGSLEEMEAFHDEGASN